ncbi:MAG: hypothetical protein QF872_07195, partial [Gammaproteobacteria bacterium]|nr:hypothetical protein [Gammaproteobacteria bacterium]
MLTNQADWRCLLVRLESDGFDTSMRRWSLLVATLAHCQPDEHTAVAWHRLLAPVLCRNASEQVRLLPHLQAWLTLEAKSQSAKYIVESAQTTKLPPPLQPKLSR